VTTNTTDIKGYLATHTDIRELTCVELLYYMRSSELLSQTAVDEYDELDPLHRLIDGGYSYSAKSPSRIFVLVVDKGVSVEEGPIPMRRDPLRLAKRLAPLSDPRIDIVALPTMPTAVMFESCPRKVVTVDVLPPILRTAKSIDEQCNLVLVRPIATQPVLNLRLHVPSHFRDTVTLPKKSD
jgi:hypothetical protein